MKFLSAFRAQINVNGHIIGTVAGSGMTARYSAMGRADLLLAAERRQIQNYGQKFTFPAICVTVTATRCHGYGVQRIAADYQRDTPVLFGLFASDPMIHLYDYLQKIRENGFSGVVNYPTLSLIDGIFGEALSEEGNTYEKEVEAIKLAHFLDLFTIAFVVNAEQARAMTLAGADVICAHLGLTKGDFWGRKIYIHQ